MNQIQYGRLFKRHVNNAFNSNIEAAEYFGCSPGLVTNVKSGRRTATDPMLEFTGHEKQVITRYRKIK